jgi:hypothetical protein
MVKILVGVVLLAHGIGHSMGLLQTFKVATVNPGWQGDSWILTGVLGNTVTQAVGVSIWTLAMLGFAALAGVVIGWLPATWWQPLSIASAALSLAGLALFPVAFPPISTLGALAVDAVVLAAVVWFHWTPGDLPG